ncbi:MAG: response regulator [Cyanothece sp. SIO1E1]|nr:response regulator [Cyanothece sp. SIO1E1]
MVVITTAVRQVVHTEELAASEQAQFFSTWKQSHFSGQLVLTGNQGQAWIFYLYMGRILYATGGIHPVRRWRRQLAAHCPQVLLRNSWLRQELASAVATPALSWEYQLLCKWVEEQLITRAQVGEIIRSIVIEVLFDLAQATQVTYKTKLNKECLTQLILLDVEQAVAAAQQLWKAWQAAKVADRSPNRAPIIKNPDQLQQCVPANLYRTLSHLLDGKSTLRDLAIKTKRDVVELTRSLLPHMQLGLIGLIDIPDLPAPIVPYKPYPSNTSTTKKQPLVACVDDSLIICKAMEKVMTASGYRFLGVQDALRSLAILLARKPDLIFLDLMMPSANGYEICSQLRKLHYFQNTPIVILTGKDGLVDRVRAKLVGASDFLSKPATADMVLGVIRKHLHEPTLRYV